MTKAIDMTGRKYGRLTVISKNGKTKDGRTTWYCSCKCGGTAVVSGKMLRSGTTKSCGCLFREMMSKTKSTHRHTTGGRFSKTYYTWTGMLTRCTNKNSTSWLHYGGRGITVCDAWKVFENFLADMGERPEGKTLDRVDNNLGYFKENCRWASNTEQRRNRRGNNTITAFGQTMCLAEWSEKTGINRTTISTRLHAGSTPEDALSRETR